MGIDWTPSNEENQWRRTFCQVPFPAIYEHADKGKRSLESLVAFFRGQAASERRAVNELRELLMDDHMHVLEECGSGSRRALLELRAFVDGNCRQKLRMAQVLDEQVAGPLASLQNASETYIETLKSEILRANKAYEAAAEGQNEAAEWCYRATMDLRDAKDRQKRALHEIGVPEFELQRLAARVAKCEEEQAQAVMVRARTKTTLYNRIISRDEMTMAVSVAYQKAEEERLDQLHASLRRFVQMETERLETSQRLLSKLATHVQSLSRAEDMQLLIHNQRDPDNLHFQGKALALLDWQWSKMHADHVGTSHNHALGLLERRSSTEDGSCAWPLPSSSASTATLSSLNNVSAIDTATLDTVASPNSPHTLLTQTPMSAALRHFFAQDKEHRASVFDEVDESEAGTELLQPPSYADNCEFLESPQMTIECHEARTSAEALVRETCKTADGRALFVKCLNRQRSLETKVKDQASFGALVACFGAFLDECVREDDVKAAKTAMILAETFYYPKTQQQGVRLDMGDDDVSDSLQSRGDRCDRQRDEDADDLVRRSSLDATCIDYTERTSEELLQRVDELHPFLHGGGLGRGATRTYLQEEVKQHSIWKTPSFWEKALLLAIGEELQRTPQPCPWEELPSGVPKHDGLPSREEAVCRVHNIVFGQLGSFTLSMLEFDVPLLQIESFVETMCDAHELTEDQRFLLRKNLHEIVNAER
uniref:SBF1/SBF2 domain-containing protein n=1 Tax=Hyaloperonospora arabidopsidis (strain Emoy2) TaxID=559515 RepID=M4BCY0_HYAAE